MRPWARAEAGVEAADDLLAARGYRVVQKGVTILTRAGYDQAVRRLLRLIDATAAGPDQAALKAAAHKLDRDWGVLTPARRDAVVAAAAQEILRVPAIVVPKVRPVIEQHAADLIEQAKAANAEAHDLKIAPGLDDADERIAAYAGRSQAHYITDAYGKRATAFEQRARDIVESGMRQGLGRSDIGKALGRDLIGPGMRTAESYWQMVAAVHTTRARSWGTLSSFREAGVERYAWSAVDDEATCDVCGFLDGQEFDTDDAADRFEQVEQADEPDAVEDLQPWIQTATDDDGQRYLVAKVGDRTHVVAHVERSREGQRDTRGGYSHAMAPARMQALGIGSPPAHGACRCTQAPAG